MRNRMLRATALLILAACQGDPTRPLPASPSLGIVDARHGAGNAHFFFLPPLVADPQATGKFDAELSTVVRICDWNGTACTSDVATFSVSGAPGSETVRLDSLEEHYIVNWHTDQFDLDPSKTYRIMVLVTGTELGHADVDVVSSGSGLRNVQTTEYIGLVNGRTLLVRFRIEEGAVYVATSEAATFTTPDRAVRLDVPAGAVDGTIGLSIVPAGPISTDPRLLAATTYDFGPDGTQFQQPVRLTIRYDPASIPAGTPESALRLHRVVDGRLYHVPGSTVDEANHTVSGLVSSFSNYGPAGSALIFATVSGGGRHSCGLTVTGAAYCWGWNSRGQLGDGTTNSSSLPVPLAGLPTILVNDAGGLQSCGIDSAVGAVCWGDNRLGALGDNSTADRATPGAVSGGAAYATIAAGDELACALDASGAAFCWGVNNFGQLGATSSSVCLTVFTCALVPVAVTGGLTFSGIAPATFHVCGLTPAGSAYCWGLAQSGQLGAPTVETCPAGAGSVPCSTSPLAVSGGLSFSALAVGAHHTCAIATGGAAHCWGANSEGRLGDGTTTGRPTPTAVAGGLMFSAVAAGVRHTCALATSGAAYCWGENGLGQLGNGTTTDSPVPVPVGGGIVFQSISSSGDHTCAVTRSGAAYCWGWNVDGQLGAPTSETCAFGSACSTVPLWVRDP